MPPNPNPTQKNITDNKGLLKIDNNKSMWKRARQNQGDSHGEF